MFTAKLRTQSGLVAVINNNQYTVANDHPCYARALEAYKANDSESFLAALNVQEAVESYVAAAGLEHRDNKVFYNGEELHGAISTCLLKMFSDNEDVSPMSNFLAKLSENPSRNSVESLFNFLNVHNLALCEDGDFLAYKSVRSDYLDKYSGKFDNKPGAVMEVPRNKVDDNPNNHCSHGFHVGALEYSGPGGWYHSNGDKVIIVKVNPKNVVSVPTDHSCQKMRVCKYEVVADYQGVLNKPVYSGEVGDDYSSNDEEDEWYDETEELSPCDMLVGNTYEFVYTDQHGNICDRYGVVEENHREDEYIICRMLDGDHSSGSLRRFNYDGIEEIEEV